MNNLRECIDCGKKKDLSYFGPSKNYKDGLRKKCKPCEAIYYRALYHKRTKGNSPTARENTEIFRDIKRRLCILEEKVDKLLECIPTTVDVMTVEELIESK